MQLMELSPEKEIQSNYIEFVKRDIEDILNESTGIPNQKFTKDDSDSSEDSQVRNSKKRMR
jgi:hypothetical protein